MINRAGSAAALLVFAFAGNVAYGQQFPGAIYTTNNTGTKVNLNIFGPATDVYLGGGPQNAKASGLPDGAYYFQVTDPSGKTLLSTDNVACRQLTVTGGRITGSSGTCPHTNGTFNSASGNTPVQLAPFSLTPNSGGEYKVWLVPTGKATISGTDAKVMTFTNANSKTDNFKVTSTAPPPPPPGSCQPSSSLSVLVQGTNVTSYVPKGSWSFGANGVSVVNVEGTAITPTAISTPNRVNSCASNPTTGTTVCTANNTDVYLLAGTGITSTLTSGGSGSIWFSGGTCTNCGVAMDAVHNKAVIGLSVAGAKGFQFLNLAGTPSFEPAFASPSNDISEDPLIDPGRNLLLSASESNNYEIVDITTTTSPAFYETAIPSAGEPDSSGEDCATGIALAPVEFTNQLYLADLTQAVFTPGSPAGTWTAPSQVQALTESVLAAGASGIAVAQGTHIGVVAGEFGGNTITAIQLPPTSGSGTPAVVDWVTCSVSPTFSNGYDPHTVTAYKTPAASGDAIALLADGTATSLAVVDLTQMLNTTIVPRTTGGHGCSAGTLPSTVVSFVTIP